jgi:hypothetical protein
VSYLGTGTANNFTENSPQWKEKTAIENSHGDIEKTGNGKNLIP